MTSLYFFDRSRCQPPDRATLAASPARPGLVAPWSDRQAVNRRLTGDSPFGDDQVMAAAAIQSIEPAVITASASVVIAVIVFVANQLASVRNDRRKARLSRVGDQLRELYGPLHALVSVNEHLWRTMRTSHLPEREKRHVSAMTVDESEEWIRWLQQGLMPANKQMRDLIVKHADLIAEDDMPVPLQDFCAHVASYEVHLARPAGSLPRQALIAHPGEPFVTYVRDGFATLKKEQARLLGGKAGGTTPSVS
ncbi:hypothetical protein ACIODS_32710 [Micromonospora chalcea]|uniref:hypothetical protein n=1 Tax=Micromonospora chalcea TaxID=1874 RepID=UPI0038292460